VKIVTAVLSNKGNNVEVTQRGIGHTSYTATHQEEEEKEKEEKNACS
jgi:hypothetical protein